MRHALVLLAAVVVGCGPQGPEPWEPFTSEPGSAVVPDRQTHRVRVSLEEGEARFWVTRSLTGSDPESLVLRLNPDLPEGAVASDLRTWNGSGWTGASVLPAAEARERFWNLSSPGQARAMPLSLLSQQQPGSVDLDLWPVEPGVDFTVEYLLRAPAQYLDGQWQLAYPPEHEDEGAPVSFELSPELQVAGARWEEEGAVLRVPRQMGSQLEVRWAFLLEGEDTFSWLQVHAAPSLSSVPVRPSVVFVLDASHSQGPSGVAAQLEVLRGYLSHVPDARVEVVVYRRFAQPLLGAFLEAPEALARLEQLSPDRLVPGNGSNLEEGAALAVELLSAQPGPRRMLLFTDDQLRPGLDEGVLSGALDRASGDLVVHLVLREAPVEEGLSLERMEAHRLAPAVERHHGMVAWVNGTAEDKEELAAQTLELVRPLRLDRLQVEGEDGRLPEVFPAGQESLPEGTGLDWTAATPLTARRVTVRAKLWGDEVSQTVEVDPVLLERLPRSFVGQDASLSSEQLLHLASKAQVASRETALLSAPEQAAPSTLGTDGSWGVGGVGSLCSCGATVEDDFWAPSASEPSPLLRAALDAALQRCRPGLAPGPAVRLRVDATGDEVVQVAVLAAPSSEAAACALEAAWGVRLPQQLHHHGPAGIELELQGRQ